MQARLMIQKAILVEILIKATPRAEALEASNNNNSHERPKEFNKYLEDLLDERTDLNKLVPEVITFICQLHADSESSVFFLNALFNFQEKFIESTNKLATFDSRHLTQNLAFYQKVSEQQELIETTQQSIIHLFYQQIDISNLGLLEQQISEYDDFISTEKKIVASSSRQHVISEAKTDYTADAMRSATPEELARLQEELNIEWRLRNSNLSSSSYRSQSSLTPPSVKSIKTKADYEKQLHESIQNTKYFVQTAIIERHSLYFNKYPELQEQLISVYDSVMYILNTLDLSNMNARLLGVEEDPETIFSNELLSRFLAKYDQRLRLVKADNDESKSKGENLTAKASRTSVSDLNSEHNPSPNKKDSIVQNNVTADKLNQQTFQPESGVIYDFPITAENKKLITQFEELFFELKSINYILTIQNKNKFFSDDADKIIFPEPYQDFAETVQRLLDKKGRLTYANTRALRKLYYFVAAMRKHMHLILVSELKTEDHAINRLVTNRLYIETNLSEDDIAKIKKLACERQRDISLNNTKSNLLLPEIIVLKIRSHQRTVFLASIVLSRLTQSLHKVVKDMPKSLAEYIANKENELLQLNSRFLVHNAAFQIQDLNFLEATNYLDAIVNDNFLILTKFDQLYNEIYNAFGNYEILAYIQSELTNLDSQNPQIEIQQTIQMIELAYASPDQLDETVMKVLSNFLQLLANHYNILIKEYAKVAKIEDLSKDDKRILFDFKNNKMRQIGGLDADFDPKKYEEIIQQFLRCEIPVNFLKDIMKDYEAACNLLTKKIKAEQDELNNERQATLQIILERKCEIQNSLSNKKTLLAELKSTIEQKLASDPDNTDTLQRLLTKVNLLDERLMHATGLPAENFSIANLQDLETDIESLTEEQKEVLSNIELQRSYRLARQHVIRNQAIHEIFEAFKHLQPLIKELLATNALAKQLNLAISTPSSIIDILSSLSVDTLIQSKLENDIQYLERIHDMTFEQFQNIVQQYDTAYLKDTVLDQVKFPIHGLRDKLVRDKKELTAAINVKLAAIVVNYNTFLTKVNDDQLSTADQLAVKQQLSEANEAFRAKLIALATFNIAGDLSSYSSISSRTTAKLPELSYTQEFITSLIRIQAECSDLAEKSAQVLATFSAKPSTKHDDNAQNKPTETQRVQTLNSNVVDNQIENKQTVINTLPKTDTEALYSNNIEHPHVTLDDSSAQIASNTDSISAKTVLTRQTAIKTIAAEEFPEGDQAAVIFSETIITTTESTIEQSTKGKQQATVNQVVNKSLVLADSKQTVAETIVEPPQGEKKLDKKPNNITGEVISPNATAQLLRNQEDSISFENNQINTAVSTQQHAIQKPKKPKPIQKVTFSNQEQAQANHQLISANITTSAAMGNNGLFATAIPNSPDQSERAKKNEKSGGTLITKQTMLVPQQSNNLHIDSQQQQTTIHTPIDNASINGRQPASAKKAKPSKVTAVQSQLATSNNPTEELTTTSSTNALKSSLRVPSKSRVKSVSFADQIPSAHKDNVKNDKNKKSTREISHRTSMVRSTALMNNTVHTKPASVDIYAEIPKLSQVRLETYLGKIKSLISTYNDVATDLGLTKKDKKNFRKFFNDSAILINQTQTILDSNTNNRTINFDKLSQTFQDKFTKLLSDSKKGTTGFSLKSWIKLKWIKFKLSSDEDTDYINRVKALSHSHNRSLYNDLLKQAKEFNESIYIQTTRRKNSTLILDEGHSTESATVPELMATKAYHVEPVVTKEVAPLTTSQVTEPKQTPDTKASLSDFAKVAIGYRTQIWQPSTKSSNGRKEHVTAPSTTVMKTN